MCPLLHEREQTLRKDYIWTTQCTMKTSSWRKTFKQESGTHTSIASFLTSILPGAQGGVEKKCQKKVNCMQKQTCITDDDLDQILQKLELCGHMCIVDCKKLRKNQSKEGNFEIIAVIN